MMKVVLGVKFQVLSRRAGRAASEGRNAQNKPNFGRSSKCKVSSVKSGKPGIESWQSSDFRLYASNFTLRRSRRPNSAKQSQTWAGWDIWGTVLGERTGQNVQNEPNLPRCPGMGAGNRGREGLRGRSCKTKPIARSGAPRRCLDCALETDLSRGDGSCKTNPICTRPEESVGQAPPYLWMQLRQTNPIRPGWQAGWVFGRGKTCETKPIARSGAPRRCPPAGPTEGAWNDCPHPVAAGCKLTSAARSDTLRVGGWTAFFLEMVSMVGGQCENHV